MRDQCYGCEHRRDVPDSAHSACVHPVTEATRRSPYMQLAGRVGKRGGNQLVELAAEYDEGPRRAMALLNIEAAAPGVDGGWFVWPVNFDPVWLTRCDGFAAKAGE